MGPVEQYYDTDGKPCSLYKMIRNEPDWAHSRIKAGEEAIEQLAALRASHSELLEVMKKYTGTLYIAKVAGNEFRAAIAKAEKI